ncbi:hypothetical protein E3983_05475 [Legionella israelensis]|uniref:Uncharacterized protein n=1 Tax=Legionella israelensis TaxID=454 RepID=A0AAX1EFF7_9GAMM|nr:hypothetical protein [Legionella israelensis]QBR83845.1 hypothetical protein E3983_05475 [Legionella israelensis]
MKKIVFALIYLISVSCFAFDHSYNVTGEDENGRELEGTIYSNNSEQDVIGELTDENGNTFEFNGKWNGYGQINGETEDGASVELNTD